MNSFSIGLLIYEFIGDPPVSHTDQTKNEVIVDCVTFKSFLDLITSTTKLVIRLRCYVIKIHL